MKQIPPQEFLDKIESGVIKVIVAIGRRVYGIDYSYDVDLWQTGKGCQVVWTDVP